MNTYLAECSGTGRNGRCLSSPGMKSRYNPVCGRDRFKQGIGASIIELFSLACAECGHGDFIAKSPLGLNGTRIFLVSTFFAKRMTNNVN